MTDDRPPSGARILIVDDTPANIAFLRDLLQQDGYLEVTSVTDPRETVTAMLAQQPDLILLDLVMPHLDGFQVLKHLRPLVPEDEFLPVLVLTADATSETRRRALASGASDFLTKPLDAVEVLLRVRNLLHTRRLHQRLRGHARELETAVRERTAELEEARGQVLELYQELARRNQQLHQMVERLMSVHDEARPASRELQPDAERLTARELDVLRLLANGQTNKELARSLSVTIATVKTHVEHIIAKLGVADRTQAAVRAVELGLLADGAAVSR
jgi:DNA-binding NarL/FixJ family response regulator